MFFNNRIPDPQIVPFGRHKGEHLSEIPTRYLKWIVGNCDFASEAFLDAAEEEYRKRLKSGTEEDMDTEEDYDFWSERRYDE